MCGSDSEEVETVAETVAKEPIPSTGDEVVDGVNNLEKDTMHESWYKALQGEFQKPYFKNVCASTISFSLVLTRFSSNHSWPKSISLKRSFRRVCLPA